MSLSADLVLLQDLVDELDRHLALLDMVQSLETYTPIRADRYGSIEACRLAYCQELIEVYAEQTAAVLDRLHLAVARVRDRTPEHALAQNL